MASKYDTTNIKTFDNEVLSIKFENNLLTALNMSAYCTVNNELAQEPGMIYKVRTYVGTGAAEDVEMGAGASEWIGSEFTETQYEVGVTAAKAHYFDEQALNDPNAVDTAIKRLSDSFTNDLTQKIVAEFDKATQVQYSFDHSFEAIIDALSMFPDDESIDGASKFLLCNKKDAAKIIKKCKDSLQYVEGFVRQGYLGTIAGVNIVQTDAVAEGSLYLADKTAVTVFQKRGVKLTTEYDADLRENKLFGNVIRVIALTDATHLVKLSTGAEA